MMGRPTAYSEELAEAILDRLMEGESLRNICLDEAIPHRSTVVRWLGLEDKADFAAKYARAREAQSDLMDDLILDTANACTPETALADRVKIGAYQWRASKLAPKKYGDKVTTELTGKDGAPIEFADSKDDPNKLRSALIARLGKLGMGGFPTGVFGGTGAAGSEPD